MQSGFAFTWNDAISSDAHIFIIMDATRYYIHVSFVHMYTRAATHIRSPDRCLTICTAATHYSGTGWFLILRFYSELRGKAARTTQWQIRIHRRDEKINAIEKEKVTSEWWRADAFQCVRSGDRHDCVKAVSYCLQHFQENIHYSSISDIVLDAPTICSHWCCLVVFIVQLANRPIRVACRETDILKHFVSVLKRGTVRVRRIRPDRLATMNDITRFSWTSDTPFATPFFCPFSVSCCRFVSNAVLTYCLYLFADGIGIGSDSN